MEKIKFSSIWNSPNFVDNEKVIVYNLGPSHKDKEFKGIIKGYYACDVDGNPDFYIIEMIDKIPGENQHSCYVIPRGCVKSSKDVIDRNKINLIPPIYSF